MSATAVRKVRSLRYVSDATPGIRRHRRKLRSGKVAFHYTRPNGHVLQDKATLDRIRALAIPPAYEDVWICPHPRGHLQATGRDARGRKQYRYHALFRQTKDMAKHARMHEFGRFLPKLRRVLRTDLKKPGLPRDKVLALVLTLMDATHVRVGSPEYARSNGSFGLSTLLDRHARFGGKGALLRFPGKGGARHDIPIEDAQLAKLVRKCQHLHRHVGPGFSAKDFRTWHATLHAYELLRYVPRPKPPTDVACRRELKKVICEVATQLRNTPAVCRKSYINPVVLSAWREGQAPFGAIPSRRSHGPGPLLALLRRSS